jgi:hypothetical protein
MANESVGNRAEPLAKQFGGGAIQAGDTALGVDGQEGIGKALEGIIEQSGRIQCSDMSTHHAWRRAPRRR